MEMVSSSQFKGKKNLVLFFYPKDDTPACTLEAIEFSDLEEEFARHKTLVFGISRDDCISHAAFRDKHGLTVQLLADVEGEVCRQFDIMHEKEKDGVTKLCVTRSTFVVDKKGVIRHALEVSNPRGHGHEVLRLIKEMDT